MTKHCPPQSTSESREEQAQDPREREGQARNLCLRLLTARARTRAELAAQLTKRGFPDDVSGRVLDRLAEVGLVDDQDFAEQWVRSRHFYAGKGKRALAAELRSKGVDDEVIAEALDDVDADAERVRAEQLVADKLRRERLDRRRRRREGDTQAGRHAGPQGIRPVDGLRRRQGGVGQRAGAPTGLVRRTALERCSPSPPWRRERPLPRCRRPRAVRVRASTAASGPPARWQSSRAQS